MRTLILMLALGLPLLAAAADPEQNQKPGAQTREWLELQKSGNAVEGAARPMPGEVADKVYQRYVDSFGRPIPESYSRDSITGGSGSSGGGSGQPK